MKRIALIGLIILLSGCQTVKNLYSLMPRDHDPSLASAFVETKIQINTLNCEGKDNLTEIVKWQTVKGSSEFLKEYASFRNDPQKESAIAVNTNILKAFDTEKESVCNHWLNLAKIRLGALEKAWSGR